MPVVRSSSEKLRLAALGLLILLLVSYPAGPLYAQDYPDPGHGFYGAVKVNGQDAAVGTVISARVGGVEYGHWTVTSPGQYALVVQGEIADDATIDFYVNDQKADQTFSFHDGWTTELDLTAAAPPDGDDPFPPRPPWWPEGFPYLTDCFIATAAYGTPTAGEIDVLREFRDAVLLESAAGSRFVALYYRFSPPAAALISRSDLLRTLVRELLVDPVVWMVRATGHLWRS
ncbi:MAG: CFI-box-CTERM domain-containing protein [Dehalococcoidia bacterium]